MYNDVDLSDILLDQDALDAADEFADGLISFDALKGLIGTEAAKAVRAQHLEEADPESYFDDPESF